MTKARSGGVGSIRIKVVSDIHGAADALRREAAGADALLVCGDLVNLIDYRTMQGIATDVFGTEVMRDFVALRTAGRFDEAGGVLRGATSGGEEEQPHRGRVASRRRHELWPRSATATTTNPRSARVRLANSS